MGTACEGSLYGISFDTDTNDRMSGLYGEP